MSLTFDKPMTLSGAIHGLTDPNAKSLKLINNTMMVSRLLWRQGRYLGRGVHVEAYGIIGCDNLVQLITVGSRGSRIYAYTHALKVIQLALAGVLYAQGFTDDLAIIVTLKTPDLEQSGLSLKTLDYYSNVVSRASEFSGLEIDYSSGFDDIQAMLELTADCANADNRLADAAAQTARAMKTFRRVPTLWDWADKRTSCDTHAGNWRVKPDGTIYLADGFC